MQLAAISGAEEAWCDKLRREVYEGLDVVLELAAVPAPAPHVDRPKPSESAIPARSSTGVRYPGNIPDPSQAEREETPAIPADLLAVLQPDAVQLIFSEFSTHMEGDDPEKWWAHCGSLALSTGSLVNWPWQPQISPTHVSRCTLHGRGKTRLIARIVRNWRGRGRS